MTLVIRNFEVTLTAEPKLVFSEGMRGVSIYLDSKDEEDVTFWVGDNNMTQTNEIGIKGTHHGGGRGAVYISAEKEFDIIDFSSLYVMGTEGSKLIVTVLEAKE